ncbi:MAG: response regulator, partial [Pirellulaceae bacterium]|nr:response regulator [Pirellulaceae bacterium]
FYVKEQLVAHVAAPAVIRADESLGVVIVLLDVDPLQSILQDISAVEGFGETGELLVGRWDGREVHYLLPTLSGGKRTTEAAKVPGMLAAISGRSGFELTQHEGVPVLMYFEPVSYQPGYQAWGLVAKMNADEAYRPLAELRRTLLALMAGLMGLGLFASFVLAQQFTRPIQKLKSTAQAIAGGDLSRRVDVKRNDELGDLASTFNNMADSLYRLNKHLESRVRDRTQELSEARDSAELANRAKSDFLANMSHEIRTPLNAVIGLTEIVMSTDLDETQRDYLSTVIDSAESLLGIINDILDFSKIEAGKLDLEQVHFNLHDTVGDTLKSIAVRARSKDLEMACLIDPTLPSILIGDPARLRQVITNLVANAIKFTHRGEVVVRVERVPDNQRRTDNENNSTNESKNSDDEIELKFSVRDTGIGVAPGNLDRLFQAFEQGDTSTSRQFGGTGLGLSICMRLVQRMDGTMSAESTLGVGSTFHFTACFKLPTGTKSTRPKPMLPLEGLRVLVVDDNATNRRILAEVTSAKNMLPVLADGVATAMQLMQQAYDSGDPIRLVLSDVNMPGGDGFELADQIRRDPRFDHVEIIFLTSAGQSGDLARCEKLRVAARLMKPVKQSELYEVMVRTLGIESEIIDTSLMKPDEPEHQVGPLNLLLAEDSLANQKVAIAILQEHGHSVTIANNGHETLDLLDQQSF